MCINEVFILLRLFLTVKLYIIPCLIKRATPNNKSYLILLSPKIKKQVFSLYFFVENYTTGHQ